MVLSSPNFEYEERYVADVIVGVDEAGRGPWAGPVVAAAANLYDHRQKCTELISQLNDSKKLSDKKRRMLYEDLVEKIDYGVGIVNVDDIDKYNILEATKLAMQEAVLNLKQTPAVALIDGNQPPKLECKTVTIVKGDAKSLSISAASVIAKVTRDNIMLDLHNKYPHYAWDKNAGYGTKVHQEALIKFGITAHHRKSYAPIKKLLANG